MHFEVPKSKFASIREFAGEYLMIVVSIGTALALEHAVQTVHHRHLAEEAAARMEAEIRANIAEIEKIGQHNLAKGKELEVLRDTLIEDIKAKKPEQATFEHFATISKGELSLSLQWPSLKHEAWDVAVANQSASWMAPEVLQRYSSAYAAVRDMQASTNTSMTFLSGPQMIKTLTDLQLGFIAPHELAYTINQMIGSYSMVNNMVRDTKVELRKALPPEQAKKA
jgi:hypothetical protein